MMNPYLFSFSTSSTGLTSKFITFNTPAFFALNFAILIIFGLISEPNNVMFLSFKKSLSIFDFAFEYSSFQAFLSKI